MNGDAERGRLLAEGPSTGPTLRTVSSNSSISSAASGTSLNHRPTRTRGRSRTVTGNSNSSTTRIITNAVNNVEAQPTNANTTRLVAADTSRAEEPNLEEPIRMTKAAKQASHLAALRTRPPPSAFSRIPLSQIDPVEGVGVNVRDSMITQESEQTNLSTIYPLSSLSSPTISPRSPTYSERSMQVEELKPFDEDDVSYRLRLLVNNNYFLPPAHSKPLPAQLTPAMSLSNAQKKPPAPTTFLDYFRIGRSKSKPPTPTSESSTQGQALTPALRTTSDATAISGLPNQMSTSPSPISVPPPRTSNLGGLPERSGRVVVVREKMVDLASAAKQAEMEIQARSLQRDTRRGDQAVNPPSIDDVIDPTDAVDLPLPSSTYPFALQTSALHGLGVNESVGAAALASRLPPPRDQSPAVSSIGPDDDEHDWKKALLKAAVGHSFDNLNLAAESAMARSPKSPSSSMMSSMLPGSPVAASPTPTPSVSAAATLAGRIDKKIISSPIHLDTSVRKSPSIHSASHIQAITPINPSRSRGWSSPASPTEPIAPSPIPIRTETPLTLVPLMPPPRSPRSAATAPKREIINPLYSISQTDLTDVAGTAAVSSSQAETSHVYTMTPPPGHWKSGGGGVTTRDSSDRGTSSSTSRSRSRRTTGESGAEGSGYVITADSSSVYSTLTGDSHGEQNSPRTSSTMSRNSTSTAQSPTTSAFQDAFSRNPSELGVDAVREARGSEVRLHPASNSAPPPIPTATGPLVDNSHFSSPVDTSNPPARSASPPTPTSGIPSSSIPDVPSRSSSTSLHYRDRRNRHFSAILQNNNAFPSSQTPQPPSSYPSNTRPPPPTLTHRSASDHGHSSFTPPPPASRRRPPTAPAAPMLQTPRIQLIEIPAPEPTTPPFPAFANLPSELSPSPNSHSPSVSPHSSPSSPSPTSSSSSRSPSPSHPSSTSLIERRRQHGGGGGGNPLRGSLHIPTSIIPPAIHSAPPPSGSGPGPSSIMGAMMMTNSPPSSSMSFFDTIQTQPNVMDFLDESSEESWSESESESRSEGEDHDDARHRRSGQDEDQNDRHEREEEEEFCTAEGSGGSPTKTSKPIEPTTAAPNNSTLSSSSPFSSALSTSSSTNPINLVNRPSTSRSSHSHHSVRSTRTPLMRLGNHSTPYVSHTSLHAYASNAYEDDDDPSPIPGLKDASAAGGGRGISSIDRNQPIGNVPQRTRAKSKSKTQPTREYFTKKIKDDGHLLESKWDLWRYTRQGQGHGAGIGIDDVVGTNTMNISDPKTAIGSQPLTNSTSGVPGTYSFSDHPYARAYGTHHSRKHSRGSRDAPSSFAGVPISGNQRTRATSSSSDRGYGYGLNQTRGVEVGGGGGGPLSQAQQKLESKKLDGMLKMHMEAEKDQMRRMAERMKQTKMQAKAQIQTQTHPQGEGGGSSRVEADTDAGSLKR
ncbi:hypothetical protein F5878DRAFT_203119 [Lentinula raphanica]|uniref:Uncharacterized protein n=1 Tax=Lentinula raphanica TaxID=153919 RepID=A0AA38P7G7_9AGAR|nr:hypothetical protein F5878DRAFT_203119 [Lentinula raphanica]